MPCSPVKGETADQSPSMRARSRRPGANDRCPSDHTRRTLGQGHASRIAHVPRAVPSLSCPHLLAARDDTIRPLHSHSTPPSSRPHRESSNKQASASVSASARPTSNVQMIRYVWCADTMRMAPSRLRRSRTIAGRQPAGAIRQPKLPSAAGDSSHRSAGLSLAGGRRVLED